MQWIILISEVPSAPAYLRVKLRRRVQRVGAIGLKGAVYVLPSSTQGMAAAAELRNEILADGGDSSTFRAEAVDGLTDEELMAAFDRERRAEYAALNSACEELERRWQESGVNRVPNGLATERGRLFSRLEEILRRDYFGCAAAEIAMQAIERLAHLGSGSTA